MKIIERNAQEIGKSLLITLPKTWTKGLGIKKGSKLKMILSENGSLVIVPDFVKREEYKKTVFTYDQFFKRRFIREYFSGSDEISILFDEKSKLEGKKKLYSILKWFMNAQVIDENAKKITIKCFRIEDLSVEECIKRMHFLTLGLFEENSDRSEIKDNITKFYYMFIMQIRMFMVSGKFTSENQMSLIKAMDYRMAAEKIQKIARFLSQMDFSKADKKIVLKLKELYTESFNSFMANDYDAALKILNSVLEMRKFLQNDLEKTNSISKYKSLNDSLMVLNYIKEISMFVR